MNLKGYMLPKKKRNLKGYKHFFDKQISKKYSIIFF